MSGTGTQQERGASHPQAPSRPIYSVVIPTFNRAGYVVDAVESVLRQTAEDIEVVVVDDGSTDDTSERLAPYAGRVIYVRTENQGPALARNEGMRRARGEYVAWLDSDDLYYPFKLRLQAAVLERFPEVGFVCSDSSAFDDAGYFDEWHLHEYHRSAYRSGGLTYDRLFQSKVPLAQLPFAAAILADSSPAWLEHNLYIGTIYEAYLKDIVVFTTTIMFRRDLLQRVGLQEPRFGMFHDLEFALRICKHFPVAFLDVPTYKLRYHSGQISTTFGPERGRIALRKQRDLLRVLVAHGVDDREYYVAHKSSMDRQQARLCRAIAIPMMSLCQGSPHEDKYFPRRARRYLCRCAVLGHPEWFLWLLSFAPHSLRRAGFAAQGLGRRLVGRLMGRKRRHD
ncbi:MAG TPA: glycosyltransferase family 2 protein [Candidatus Methanoperedens sp.]|nr:glycosyltransferase family 2 protein [Candidatus Methanoperedens sp.]